ncbi:MAG TPA: sulfite exporter TauE/SafE family protein, partial [Steroidobacteraceae bacterium]|nr:sulfite exporter TauE/SafE family protein [Steroidobacteraceae bacterium]
PLWMLPLVVAAAIYGGFFGAGMSVIVLALLGLGLSDPLPRLNALKQAMALAINGAAALWLALRAPVNWRVVAVLAASALLGGIWGGRLAGRLSPLWLRRVVVLLGVAVATLYLWRAR